MSERIVRLGIRVRADRAERALADLLPILADGAEERRIGGDVEYAVYAPAGELPPRDVVRALAGDALVEVRTSPVPNDWERRWHEFLRPVRVGGLVVRPPWVAGDDGDLVIDPGVWFGAGGHATTGLCLRLLLEAVPRGALCDWGAGTGVLAVAAARLGWAPVTAVELQDSGGVIAANAVRNRVSVGVARLDLRTTPAPWAPTVVANLPRDVLLSVALDRPPERLLASGFLRGEAGEVAAAYRRFGLHERRRLEDGDWAAVVLA